MKTLLEQIEPALSFVREELRSLLQRPGGAGPAPAELHELLAALGAARTFLDLQRTPEYVAYDPRSLLRPLAEADRPRCAVELGRVSECIGDPGQVRACIELALANAVLERDAALEVELLEHDEVPQVRVAFDGPGHFADPLSIAGLVEVPFDELAARWTAATRGGRIDKTPYGSNLRLKGVRVLPESRAGLEVHAAVLRTIEDRLASRGEEDFRPRVREALTAVEGILAALEDDARAGEPGNLCALVEAAVAEHEPALKRLGIAVESWCDRNVPPIPMRRERLRSFFANAFRYSGAAVAPGGSVALLVDYDEHARVVGIAATLDGLRAPASEDARTASMRRAIVELHGGTFNLESSGTGATITATLPDPVGRRLDEWIPGWQAFGERSRQVLRLLKSGGPTPPEDFLLEGVLEEELEHWLLPRLETPLAVNLAHELQPGGTGLPGASPERLEKALGQVRKRKPRKEIARPAYAAEVLWAYRSDPRSRAALGMETLSEDEIRALCEALLRRPPHYVAALRLVAAARRG